MNRIMRQLGRLWRALSTLLKKSKVEQGLQKMIDDAIKTTTGEEVRSEPRLRSGSHR